jgi:hypothetical protein
MPQSRVCHALADLEPIMKSQTLSAVAIGIAVIIACSPYALAVDCDRNPAFLLDIRSGILESGDVRFSYESRIEKFSSSARKFVWCIEADKNNQNIAEFHWGDSANEGKYLNTLIEPGRCASSTT